MRKTVLVRFSIQKDVDQFLQKAKKMVETTNKEEGCLTYKLYQSFDNELEFIFYEKYTNQEALDAHNTSKHFNTFISEISPNLASEPIIEVF